MKTSELTMTIADWEAIPEDGNKYELIEGEILVSRAPGWKHQRAVHYLQHGLELYLAQNPIGVLAPGPGLIFDNFNGVIPDLVFVSNDRLDGIILNDRLMAAPDIVLEVLSPGNPNQTRDRKLKRQLYARFGVKEYWIADPANRLIEIYSLVEDVLVLVATFSGNDKITSSVLPDLELKITDVFRS